METTLDAQLVEFAALGEVVDPAGTDQAVAQEIADALMRGVVGGPLERISRLNNLLRILKLVTRIVTSERDLSAYSGTAVWPYRRLSRLASVHVSTMQNWVTAGRKLVAAQDVSRETTPVNAKLNGAE